MQLGLGGKRRIDARLTSPELDIDYFLPPPEIPPGNAEEPPPDAGVLARSARCLRSMVRSRRTSGA